MIQNPKLETGADVVTFLKAQHKEVKALFGTVLNAKGAAKEASFRQLCDLLAAHEAGEAAIVHPAAARVVPNGEVVVNERLHEESKAKRAVLKLKALNVNTTEFDDQLRSLQTDVLAHAEHEEKEEFDKLPQRLDENALQQMREAVVAVENKQASSARPDRVSTY